MEFGPRALGSRSILGDPRSPTMQKMLNLKVKYRESFRPFAPSVLRERVARVVRDRLRQPLHAARRRRGQVAPERDDGRGKALFGIEKLNVPRSDIPAVTHVDYSARIQTVHRETNPRYHALIAAFERMTGCPVIVNTSFNVRGEPIVCTPEDAFRCFMGTEIDGLAVGNCFLRKEDRRRRCGRTDRAGVREGLTPWRRSLPKRRRSPILSGGVSCVHRRRFREGARVRQT